MIEILSPANRCATTCIRHVKYEGNGIRPSISKRGELEQVSENESLGSTSCASLTGESSCEDTSLMENGQSSQLIAIGICTTWTSRLPSYKAKHMMKLEISYARPQQSADSHHTLELR